MIELGAVVVFDLKALFGEQQVLLFKLIYGHSIVVQWKRLLLGKGRERETQLQ